jgi:hypothetical protein
MCNMRMISGSNVLGKAVKGFYISFTKTNIHFEINKSLVFYKRVNENKLPVLFHYRLRLSIRYIHGFCWYLIYSRGGGGVKHSPR